MFQIAVIAAGNLKNVYSRHFVVMDAILEVGAAVRHCHLNENGWMDIILAKENS